MKIPFFEFRFDVDQRRLLDRAVSRVMDRGVFISGPELNAFEDESANFLGVDHVIGVGSGFDALFISLKSISESPLKVALPANAYHATINAVLLAGHRPCFHNIDPNSDHFASGLSKFIEAKEIDVILPIHYFGKPNAEALNHTSNTVLIEDFSQAFGSAYEGKKCGTFGLINAASLYPTKNLGAMGDAGIICTNDDELAKFCREFRNYGEKEYYLLNRIGVNSRLDEIQAAILRINLMALSKNIELKKETARFYFENLNSIGDLLLPTKESGHTYHQFVIKTSRRDGLKEYLFKNGIETKVHYPVSIFEQLAYRELNLDSIDRQSLYTWHNHNLSLPSFPGIKTEELHFICHTINKYFSS